VSRCVGEFLGTYALSLAPALVSGNLSQVWIYLTAPFLGAVLAILSCQLLRDEGCCRVGDQTECVGEV
jgi:glycerol uptake facilitator-like aquaporin